MGLGFEFGPQRIMDLAIVCPQSVARGITLTQRCPSCQGCHFGYFLPNQGIDYATLQLAPPIFLTFRHACIHSYFLTITYVTSTMTYCTSALDSELKNEKKIDANKRNAHFNQIRMKYYSILKSYSDEQEAFKMKFFIFCLLCLILIEFCLGDKTSKFSTLRNAIFEGYESDAKPDGKIDVESGLMITDFNLCPKNEVHNKQNKLRQFNNPGADTLSLVHIQIGIWSPNWHIFDWQFCMGLLQTICNQCAKGF